MYYEHDQLNGIHHLYSCFDCMAPNNFERDNDIVDFETHDNENVFTSNLKRNSTLNSSKHGSLARELSFDLAENYALLFLQTAFGSVGIEDLRAHPALASSTQEEEENETYFDLCDSEEDYIVEREVEEHEKSSYVWARLYDDKRNSTNYSETFRDLNFTY